MVYLRRVLFFLGMPARGDERGGGIYSPTCPTRGRVGGRGGGLVQLSAPNPTALKVWNPEDWEMLAENWESPSVHAQSTASDGGREVSRPQLGSGWGRHRPGQLPPTHTKASTPTQTHR